MVVKVSSKQPSHYRRHQEIKLSSSPMQSKPEAFFIEVEVSEARQEITSGPQKEGQTGVSRLAVAKFSDHLHPQVSLDSNNLDDSTLTVQFVAGKLKHFASVWQTITSDFFILSAVTSIKIDFSNYPKQTISLKEYNFNVTELDIINSNVLRNRNNLENRTFWTRVHQISVRPKKDGLYRLILNLKYLNEFIQYHHFKMENFKSAI